MSRIVLVMLLLVSPSLASTPGAAPDGNSPRLLAEQAMKFVASEDMKGLFAFIGKHMPIPKDELKTIHEATVTQRKALTARGGAYLGYGFVEECRRSDFLVRVTYAEMRAKDFIRWQFIFYKPRGTWQISSFFWDSKTTEVFLPCN